MKIALLILLSVAGTINASFFNDTHFDPSFTSNDIPSKPFHHKTCNETKPLIMETQAQIEHFVRFNAEYEGCVRYGMMREGPYDRVTMCERIDMVLACLDTHLLTIDPCTQSEGFDTLAEQISFRITQNLFSDDRETLYSMVDDNSTCFWAKEVRATYSRSFQYQSCTDLMRVRVHKKMDEMDEEIKLVLEMMKFKKEKTSEMMVKDECDHMDKITEKMEYTLEQYCYKEMDIRWAWILYYRAKHGINNTKCPPNPYYSTKKLPDLVNINNIYYDSKRLGYDKARNTSQANRKALQAQARAQAEDPWLMEYAELVEEETPKYDKEPDIDYSDYWGNYDVLDEPVEIQSSSSGHDWMLICVGLGVGMALAAGAVALFWWRLRVNAAKKGNADPMDTMRFSRMMEQEIQEEMVA